MKLIHEETLALLVGVVVQMILVIIILFGMLIYVSWRYDQEAKRTAGLPTSTIPFDGPIHKPDESKTP